jgi:hypothetical protein
MQRFKSTRNIVGTLSPKPVFFWAKLAHDSYRARASALHDRARAARADAAATKSHSEQTRLLATTLTRHPTFSEWCVTNKARLEAEQALREDIDSRRDRRVHAPEAEHVRKAARTWTPSDDHEWLAERYRAKKTDLNLAMHVRQELRNLGVRDDKLPSHAEIVAQFEDLRTEIQRSCGAATRGNKVRVEAHGGETLRSRALATPRARDRLGRFLNWITGSTVFNVTLRESGPKRDGLMRSNYDAMLAESQPAR